MNIRDLYVAGVAAALLLFVPGATFAQFPNKHPDPAVQMPAPPEGGPVAIGQAQLQRSDDGRIALIQAPPVPAASTGGGVIQLSAFGWLQPYVDTVVQALIVAFFAWIGKSKYSQWLDQSSRDALEVFVKNRASSLLADGAVRLQGKAVHVDNALLYRSAAESATAIPDALKRFGLTPEVVAAKIIDAIPQTQAGAAIIATAHTEDAGSAPVAVTDRPAAAPTITRTNNAPPTSAAS